MGCVVHGSTKNILTGVPGMNEHDDLLNLTKSASILPY